ncbi:MAG: MotA/TolQ/ExbB proton channel family protein [Gammaproteobacteria bacterium]|nr:MotA/TolQ/ExbB proton channel family protein [Gammaproteobacteria bacterium]
MLPVNHSGMWFSQPRYTLFLRWLILAGLITFGTWMAWDMHILQRLLLADKTRIGMLITVVFLFGSTHCAARSVFLSRQQEALESIIRMAARDLPQVRNGRLLFGQQTLTPPSLAESYLVGAISKRSLASTDAPASDQQLLAQVMAEQARGQHEAGWFVANSLVKLGLLGTVIGFVLMLTPVTTLESFDQSQVQNLLKQMTVGMGVALNTTLLGLIGTMLLGIQYLLLDRAADRLVAQTVDFAEAYLSTRPVAED